MRVLLDTNILLDYYLAREPFFQLAAKIIAAHQKGAFVGHVAAITPINLYYIARKIKGDKAARVAIQLLLATFEVVPINHAILTDALQLPLNDYEDAVHVQSASLSKMDAIITRDSKDFRNSDLPIYSPSDFLKTLNDL